MNNDLKALCRISALPHKKKVEKENDGLGKRQSDPIERKGATMVAKTAISGGHTSPTDALIQRLTLNQPSNLTWSFKSRKQSHSGKRQVS